MQNRTPVARAARPALPAFEPVPRKYRHDGWTPERQVAFIEALADTGCVSRAAGMVNMAQANCYTLRRAPGAEEFRRAWDAALDFGVARLKDIAFERAIEGEMVPVFHGDRLMGFRRKRNDALLMFCLRHYGTDAGGRRTTVNYFKATAAAGTGASDGGGAAASAETTTMRVTSGERASPAERAAADDARAAELAGFAGVTLDDEAAAAIARALSDCAERARALEAAAEGGVEAAIDAALDDPAEEFVRAGVGSDPYRGTLEPMIEVVEPTFRPDEPRWQDHGADRPAALIAWEEARAAALLAAAPAGEEDGVAAVKRPVRRRRKAASPPPAP